MILKLKKTLSLFLLLLATPLLAGELESEAQIILNKLGYNISVDGVWDKQSQLIMSDFYRDRRQVYDGILDQNEMTELKKIQKGLTSELARENSEKPQQPPNLCCAGVTVGNFHGNKQLEYFTVSSPKDYVQYLWGNPNPDVAKGYRLSKEGVWTDEIQFLTLSNGKAQKLNKKIIHPEGFCLHNSQSVAGDFNSDGIDDILVACHGYDARPWPGDHSYVVLSQNDGSFKSQRITKKPGFYHGATIFDVNGDTHLDVILTNSSDGKGKRPKVTAHLGNGKGEFSKAKTLIGGLRANYSISSFDFNYDGHVDIILGGHEVDPHGSTKLTTKIYFNNGKGKFSSRRSNKIKKNQKYSIVLDFLVYRNFLFVVRTSGYPNPYKGGAIQQIDLNTMKQIGLLTKENARHPRRLRRVASNNGTVKFGTLDQYAKDFDFYVNNDGKMEFVR